MSTSHKQKRGLRAEAASPWLGQRLPQGKGLCPLPDSPTALSQETLRGCLRELLCPAAGWGSWNGLWGWGHCTPTVTQGKGSPWWPLATRSIWAPLSSPDPRATTQHYLTLCVWTPETLPALLLAAFSRARCSRDTRLLSNHQSLASASFPEQISPPNSLGSPKPTPAPLCWISSSCSRHSLSRSMCQARPGH